MDDRWLRCSNFELEHNKHHKNKHTALSSSEKESVKSQITSRIHSLWSNPLRSGLWFVPAQHTMTWPVLNIIQMRRLKTKEGAAVAKDETSSTSGPLAELLGRHLRLSTYLFFTLATYTLH